MNKLEIMNLMDKSDKTILRCLEQGIPIPQEWKDYRMVLRAVITSGGGDVPSTPQYPTGIKKMAQLPAWLRIFKSADKTAPAVDAQVVTSSNSVDLPQGTCLALYVGYSGDVTLIRTEEL